MLFLDGCWTFCNGDCTGIFAVCTGARHTVRPPTAARIMRLPGLSTHNTRLLSHGGRDDVAFVDLSRCCCSCREKAPPFDLDGGQQFGGYSTLHQQQPTIPKVSGEKRIQVCLNCSPVSDSLMYVGSTYCLFVSCSRLVKAELWHRVLSPNRFRQLHCRARPAATSSVRAASILARQDVGVWTSRNCVQPQPMSAPAVSAVQLQ
jgi:hypothetical protein